MCTGFISGKDIGFGAIRMNGCVGSKLNGSVSVENKNGEWLNISSEIPCIDMEGAMLLDDEMVNAAECEEQCFL